MKLIAIAAVAVALGLGIALTGIGRPESAHSEAAPSQAQHGITVTGTGSVQATPDEAQFSFGVATQGLTAEEALSANGSAANKVIAALKHAGVRAADIQTASVLLEPRYSNDGSAVVGYTATNSVSATLHDLAKSGAVVDAVVAAGANQVSGPGLTRFEQSAFYRKALQSAIADARSKAETIARESGVQLGSVRSVVEGSNTPPPQPFAVREAAALDSTPIEPGTQTIEATVTVEFAVR
jgi:uncharacterized protein YggE